MLLSAFVSTSALLKLMHFLSILVQIVIDVFWYNFIPQKKKNKEKNTMTGLLHQKHKDDFGT